MDYYAFAPEFAVGRQCRICDSEIAAGEPVMADYDYATDTGAWITVECVSCYLAHHTAKAVGLRVDAAMAREQGKKAVARSCDQLAARHEFLLGQIPERHQ